MTTTTAESKTTTLVLGATGATGKWVVQQLLDQGHSVKAIVRSKQRLMDVLQEIDSNVKTDHLSITEASLLDLSDKDLQEQIQGCDAVVSCLGHNMNIEGMWGKKSRRLVTETVKRVTDMISKHSPGTTKFILMGSDGVANPNGQDDPRGRGERLVLFLLRYLVPPHVDNEEAAAYLHSLGEQSIQWSVIRPTNLIDGPPTGKYQWFDKPVQSLFGDGTVTRSHVAQAMVELITDPAKWKQYKFQMPVLHDLAAEEKKSEL